MGDDLAMAAIGADDVRVASRLSRQVLMGISDRDWTAPAGSLDWDCRTTAAHIADALAFYAAHLAGSATDWLKFDLVPHADASNPDLGRLIEAIGEVLAQVIEATPEEVRAFHHSGLWDKSGFAAMACLETLVHTADITVGLGVTFDPPREVCQRIVDRLFVGDPSDEEPWQVLWWGTGRGDLPGRERLGPDWEINWLKGSERR